MFTMHGIARFFVLMACAVTPSHFIIKSIQGILCAFIARAMGKSNFFAFGFEFFIGCGFKPTITIAIPIIAGLKQISKEPHNIPPI